MTIVVPFGEIRSPDFRELIRDICQFEEVNSITATLLEAGDIIYVVMPNSYDHTVTGIYTYDVVDADPDRGVLSVKAPGAPFDELIYMSYDILSMWHGKNSHLLSRAFLTHRDALEYQQLVESTAALYSNGEIDDWINDEFGRRWE